jgi:epoxyqueuosine reductase
MQNAIQDILKQHVEVFGFVPVSVYRAKRDELGRSDGFSDYAYLEDYTTIITLAIPYPSKLEKWKKKGYGILSRYAYGTDYHRVFRRILAEIVAELEEIGVRAKAAVDISGVDERFASHLASMGWLGKNQYLITEDYGTYSFLATILVDVELDTMPRVHDDCGDCRACIDACPSGALDDGFAIDRCISHLSQEKIPFDDTQISYFKTMIFGCDICQRVCPKNGAIDIHRYPEFEPQGIENIDLKQILAMSNREYMRMYGHNASSWRGATVIKRNALALIANQRLTALIPDIEASMDNLKDTPWYVKTAERVLDILRQEKQP